MGRPANRRYSAPERLIAPGYDDGPSLLPAIGLFLVMQIGTLLFAGIGVVLGFGAFTAR